MLRYQLRDEGILSWKISRLRRLFRTNSIFKYLADVIFNYRGVIVILFIRAACSLALLIVILQRLDSLAPILLWGIALSSLLLSLRHFFGQEGSDQMTIIITIALAVAYTFPASTFISLLMIFFIAGQLTLSYFTSGIAKVGGTKWRKGTALSEILLTRTYGTRAIGELLQRLPVLSLVTGWFVIIFEILFPLVFVIPEAAAWTIMTIGLIFHVGNAVLMGLNGFVWAYFAAYPSLAYIVANR